MVRSIVVGTDGSDTANAAVAEAIDLATSEEARLVFVTAYPDPSRFVERLSTTGQREHVNLRLVAESILARAGRDAEAAGVQYDTYDVEDEPADAIIDVARDQDADLIVVGDRGLRGVTRFLLGSVSDKVVRHAPCSTMIVRVAPDSAQ